MSKTKSELHKILASEPRLQLSEQISKAASVALLLSGELDRLEVFFIKRATNPSDHWSGHVAFPGGRQEDIDSSLMDTCLREVREELGLSLSERELVGNLNDIQARRLGQMMPFFIRPYVFHLENKPALQPQISEVAGTLWVSISDLAAPANQSQFSVVHDHVTVKLPAIALPGGDTLWGLTYMMIQDFLGSLR